MCVSDREGREGGERGRGRGEGERGGRGGEREREGRGEEGGERGRGEVDFAMQYRQPQNQCLNYCFTATAED